MEEKLILVSSKDRQTGVASKMEVHHQGLRHRAFSILLFDSQGRMLMQQRALGKYHSGGLWTNTCCGHPRPGERTAAAALPHSRQIRLSPPAFPPRQIPPGGHYREAGEPLGIRARSTQPAQELSSGGARGQAETREEGTNGYARAGRKERNSEVAKVTVEAEEYRSQTRSDRSASCTGSACKSRMQNNTCSTGGETPKATSGSSSRDESASGKRGWKKRKWQWQ